MTEARDVVALISGALGAEPEMWGASIIGWGRYTYRYASGHEGEWMKVGFSPRKTALTFYGLQDSRAGVALLTRLGAHTTGVGCVYVKRLDGIDGDVLAELARVAFARGDFDARAE